MDKYKTHQTIQNTPFLSSFISTNKKGQKRPSIRFYRYLSMVFIHLLFIISFWIDIQILEGNISASRLFGFHLSDPFLNMEVGLAREEIHINLLIGAISIGVFYALFAGRAFCSWVCPYNFFGEIAERLNGLLIKKKLIKQRIFNYNARYIFWVTFLLLSVFSGYLVFEVFNVVGILSRFLIYGYSLAIWWVLAVFLIEIFYSRRFWCRYICPIGTTYSLISKFRAIKISWNKEKCDHCGVCMDVCIHPKVLEITKDKNKNKDGIKFSVISGDCTLCGRCIDVCHSDALDFENRIKKIL